MPRWKRVLDIMCGLAAMPLLALLTLLTAVVLNFLSPGPLLFREERVGYRGRRFGCYKFRTMRASGTRTSGPRPDEGFRSGAQRRTIGAGSGSWPMQVGRLLRASHLNEFPAIINVLRGEMSLVGPRPCTPAEYVKFNSEQRENIDAVPGLTGFWQITRGYGNTVAGWVRLDALYIRKKTLWLDLKIVLRTLPALLRQAREGREEKLSWSRTGTSSRASA